MKDEIPNKQIYEVGRPGLQPDTGSSHGRDTGQQDIQVERDQFFDAFSDFVQIKTVMFLAAYGHSKSKVGEGHRQEGVIQHDIRAEEGKHGREGSS